ncbi:MAG: tetratricopeptide repeat protein [Burkholderiales bacterium]|jgi:tetratricopeptide (TPR) repeat protein|nr:tetratricopeptide repeat protein [Burkholderiales bacterium]
MAFFHVLNPRWRLWFVAVFVIVSVSALTACMQPVIQPVAAGHAETQNGDLKNPQTQSADVQTPPLTEERFYDILLANVALQRNDPVLATRTFLRIAEETKAPWFAQRATESALAARDNVLLKDSLELWQTLAPKAERPQRLRQQLARFALSPLKEQADEWHIRESLAGLLRDASSTDTLGAVFLQINSALRQLSDKRVAFDIVRDVSLPYPYQPEAHYALALAAFLATPEEFTGEPPEEIMAILREGEEAIDDALRLEPEWDEALQLKALLLDRADSEELLPWLLKTIEEYPDKKILWSFVARVYVKQKNFGEAREWFLKIWRDDGSDDALVAAAALSMEMRDHRAVLDLLEDVRQSGAPQKANELIKTYARIAEDERRLDEAIYWYKQITKDEHWWSIQIHIAQLLLRADQSNEAMTWLADLPAITLEERISVAQMRAMIYRHTEEWEKARVTLEEAVSQLPQSAELHMDLALVEEKQGKIKAAVARLRQALALSPNEPYIQNGLGYTLVDHQINIEEGAALIEKALQAKPEDGAILDSMGWALYRQGKLEEALPYLRKAMETLPDSEVAAHLGEVLWQLGKLEEARQVWKHGLQGVSKDSLIHETMRRLNIDEPLTPTAP